jgi:hypothetical protein
MPQNTVIGRSGFIRPTETQIRTNTIVVPRAFITDHRRLLRWFHGFDVTIENERIANRKLDLENRIGGIRLRAHFAPGDLLRLEIVDETTLRIRKAEEAETIRGFR